MHTLLKNKQSMKYALQIGEVPIYNRDENGEIIYEYYEDSDGNIIYYEDENGLKTMKEVTVGETINNSVEILSGLEENEQVIAN